VERCIDVDSNCGKYILKENLRWFEITGSGFIRQKVVISNRIWYILDRTEIGSE